MMQGAMPKEWWYSVQDNWQPLLQPGASDERWGSWGCYKCSSEG